MTFTFNFEQLIAPISPDVFFQAYWEQQPLVVSSREEGYYHKLFSVRDLDSVFLFSKLYPPDIRVIANQQEMLPAHYIDESGSLKLNQLYQAYQNGHTLIVNGLQRFWQPLAAFCSTLHNQLHHPVVANLYFSPPHSKGLHPHYDAHDVFVLQVEGCKHWQIHSPTNPVPLLNSFQPILSEQSLGEPMTSLHLQPGDLLYIPRGYVHHAATDDAFSLHLTIGLYSHQWFDVIVHALTALAVRDVRFRQAIPAGFLDSSEQQQDELHAYLQELTQTLADKASFQEALASLGDRHLRACIPQADGQFAQLTLVDSITPEYRITRRTGLRCRLLHQVFSVSIQFSGTTLHFPASHYAALKAIAESTQPLMISDLPDLLPDAQLELVRRLVRTGLVQVERSG
jgi:ribosomal protein L16 Arg81 hydroxylase